MSAYDATGIIAGLPPVAFALPEEPVFGSDADVR
jgi:hypothetical protein